MIRIKVAFCVKNLARVTGPVRQQLLQEPDLDVVEYGCTSNCGICRKYHVAVVNGKPVKATTENELIENIESYIDEELLDQL